MKNNNKPTYLLKSRDSFHNEIIFRLSENKQIHKQELQFFLKNTDVQDLAKLACFLRRRIDDKIITYSRKVFINLINLCKDSCSYCTYKKEPYESGVMMLNPSQVLSIAESGKQLKCTEALIVTGERPDLKYPQAKKWLNELGYRTLTELIMNLSENILKKTGMLPHTNAGSLTKKEMSMLKPTNLSLGMMLENSSELLTLKGNAHANAPSKNPKVRLKSIVSAGELNFPITTGLLIGIGESFDEVFESLFLINEINKKYGHIQEVIIQNFVPKKGTLMEYYKSPSHSYFLKCITAARIVLEGINIQVPPNLSPRIYSEYLDAGINDWGGISPLTPDYVNPECPWPTIENVQRITHYKGFNLRARLPLYAKYLTDPVLRQRYVHNNLKGYITPLIDKYGLVKEEYIKDEN